MARSLARVLIGLVAAGGAAAVAGAQAPAPVVTLTFTGDGPPAVAGAEGLPGGATTFRVVDQRRVRRGRDVALVRLEPGRTLADATPVLARVDEEGPPVLRGVAAIDHWLSSEPGRTPRSLRRPPP